MEKAREIGMDAYEAELNEKIEILEKLLSDYDDGRKKNLFCVAVNLFNLTDIRTIMEQLGNETEALSKKEKAAIAARLFEDTAIEKDISLKLRKLTH